MMPRTKFNSKFEEMLVKIEATFVAAIVEVVGKRIFETLRDKWFPKMPESVHGWVPKAPEPEPENNLVGYFLPGELTPVRRAYMEEAAKQAGVTMKFIEVPKGSLGPLLEIEEKSTE